MSGVFLDLVSQDQIAKVVLGIEAAVLQSFETDQVRLSPILIRQVQITQDEMKRRSQLCIRIFRELRGDLKWGIERILGHMPIALRTALDGGDWRPEQARTIWRPTPQVG
jgi:hypothetical protein